MSEKVIKLSSVGDIKELTQVASHCPFTVMAASGSTIIDAASILASLSIDVTKPITLRYEGENEELEAYIEAHKGA